MTQTMLIDRGNRAVFSPCKQYRFRLERDWSGVEDAEGVHFVLLNPSTADADKPDNTVTRLINFGKAWGFGRMMLSNIFAYKSTDPRELYTDSQHRIGADNDGWILDAAQRNTLTVVAWGNHGELLGRGRQVTELLGTSLHCFGVNSTGHPIHPLYLAAETSLTRFPGYQGIAK